MTTKQVTKAKAIADRMTDRGMRVEINDTDFGMIEVYGEGLLMTLQVFVGPRGGLKVRRLSLVTYKVHKSNTISWL